MSHPKPTDGELAILRLLWERGPSTVKDLHRTLQEGRDLPYTTVLSALQSMTEKALVHRDTSARQHVYTAAVAEAEAQSSLLEDLVDKAFRGSARDLMVHAIESGKVDLEDLEAMKRLITARKRGGEA